MGALRLVLSCREYRIYRGEGRSGDRAFGQSAPARSGFGLRTPVAGNLGADFAHFVPATTAVLTGARGVHHLTEVSATRERLSDEFAFVESIAAADDHETLLALLLLDNEYHYRCQGGGLETGAHGLFMGHSMRQADVLNLEGM